MSERSLNRPVIEELRKLMGQDFNKLLDVFVIDGQERLKRLEDALSQGEAQVYWRACHSLNGSASNLGLLPLVELCRVGEQIGHSQEGFDLHLAQVNLGALQVEWARVQALLKQERI